MIISKIRGSHHAIPIGKIKLSYLYETLRYVCSIHPLFDDSWKSLQTSRPDICLKFILEHTDITYSAVCTELGFFIKTTMALLNHQSHRSILADNFKAFDQILQGLQSNPNVATISKCVIYKIPFDTPFMVKSKFTTYYLLFNFWPVIQSQKLFQELSDASTDFGKKYFSIILFLSVT